MSLVVIDTGVINNYADFIPNIALAQPIAVEGVILGVFNKPKDVEHVYELVKDLTWEGRDLMPERHNYEGLEDEEDE